MVTGGHWWSLEVTGGHWWSLVCETRDAQVRSSPLNLTAALRFFLTAEEDPNLLHVLNLNPVVNQLIKYSYTLN